MKDRKLWGMKSNELLFPFPCDAHMGNYHDAYYRGVTIHAHAEVVFRWICQMKVAPYSYDWIDNLGRKSPQKLIPGLDVLKIGQKVMFIFDLVDFEKNKHLTLRVNKIIAKLFGDTVISYHIFSENHETCRLLVKILVHYPKGIYGKVIRYILPRGDLIMMRRQLFNFKTLAEKT